MNKIWITLIWATAMFAAFWAFTSAPDAHADSDPHVPNWSVGWCPGGGNVRANVGPGYPSIQGYGGYCDGVPYDDGSFLHQVPQNAGGGIPGYGVVFQTFCRVNQGSLWSPPAPPGACDGVQN